MKGWGLQEHWESQFMLSESILQGEEDAKKASESVFAGLLVAGLNWTGLSQSKRIELSVGTGSLCRTHRRDEGSWTETATWNWTETNSSRAKSVMEVSAVSCLSSNQLSIAIRWPPNRLVFAGTCCSMQQWRENAREVGQGAGTWKWKQCPWHGALLPMQGWHRL